MSEDRLPLVANLLGRPLVVHKCALHEKAKRYAAQKKELLKRKKAEESKKRTHRLCQVGGAVESVLGAPIEEEDIPKLIGFLKKQEANGKFFSKAMQKETNTDMEEV